MRRVLVPELLDSDLGTPEEIAASLQDLERINRLFGGVTATATMLTKVRRNTTGQVSLLDVAAGDSTVVESAAKRAGVDVRITRLDRSPRHLSSRSNSVAGDALAIPFQSDSFDLVHSCLFLHHLTDEQVVQFLTEALRVARTAVLINDLRRSWIHLMIVYAGKPLFSRITRHDSVASIRRAYTVDEAFRLAKRTDSRSIEIRKAYLYRFGMIVWK
jgi:ubiquinone/menaquinone biosynthesis C-methylase UbiE